ncbi:perlucin-like protein [Mytilus trossulus]|uniref:perlucin-like protein n=1 Tax=Mytilus trossulus TaxID=6551 RepID=UPI0030059E6C
MYAVTPVLLICLCTYAIGVYLPCLTNESKKDLDDSRTALTSLETYLGSTVNTIESDIQKTLNTLKSHLGTLKSNVGSKVKNLDGDLQVLMGDLKKKKWVKHNGHCYFYSTESSDWFTAERRCREIGGYIVKVDDTSENTWITDNKPNKNVHYWIGLTDLKEGDWRWTFDQSLATYKPWLSGYGAKGTAYNCVAYSHGSSGLRLWFDQTCSTNYNYICESNFCF